MLSMPRRKLRQRKQRDAIDSHLTAARHLSDCLNGLRGLPGRLALLADAAREAGATSRRCDSVHLIPHAHNSDMAAWMIPEELHPDSIRLGDAKRWQALDRAVAHLLAVIDDQALGFDAQADAYEQLATAARSLAAEVADSDRPRGHKQCWFCGQPAQQVEQLIAGPHASICSQCVELCNEVLG